MATVDPVAQARLYRDAAASSAGAARTSATLASNSASVAAASAAAAQAALVGLTTTGTFSTKVVTPLVDAYAAGPLTLGTTTATSIALMQSTTLPTGKTLTVGANVLVSSDQLAAAKLLIASQAVGDLLYASTTTAWARLAAVATGRVLASAGTGTAPAWSATPSVTTLTGSTSLLTPLVDAVAAGALAFGTTTATSIALQQNVTMPTTKTLVVGANTLISADQLNAAKLLIAAQAAGDTLYASSTTAWARLARGSDGQVLTLASGLPSWAAAATGLAGAPAADAAGLGAYAVIRVPMTDLSGGGAADDDITVYATNSPALRIFQVEVMTSAGPGTGAVGVYTAVAAGGTALSQVLFTTSTGVQRETNRTATQTIAANTSIYVRRTGTGAGNSIVGEVLIYVQRT